MTLVQKTNNNRLTGIKTRVQSGKNRAGRVHLFSETKGQWRYDVVIALISCMMKPRLSDRHYGR